MLSTSAAQGRGAAKDTNALTDGESYCLLAHDEVFCEGWVDKTNQVCTNQPITRRVSLYAYEANGMNITMMPRWVAVQMGIGTVA